MTGSVQVTDRAGNTATLTSPPVKIDRVAPRTAASAPSGWAKADVTLTLSATDDLAGVKETYYRIDGGAVQAGTSPVVSTEGVHTVQYWSVDRAGNAEAPKTVTVQLDKSAPTVTYGGNAGSYTVDQRVNITCLAADALSGIDSTTCQNAAGPADSFPLGANSLSATATDRAGNVGTGSAAFTVAVTPASLAALTMQFVQGSVRYQALSAQQKAAVDRLGAAAALHLSVAWSRLTPAQRTQAVSSYTRAVAALGPLGWLTADQAATLLRLAAGL